MREIADVHGFAFDGPPVVGRSLLVDGEVTRADISRLEPLFFGAGTPGRRHVEALFALNRSPVPKCAAWTSFFVEAVTDYVVWQVRPTGIVSDDLAEWLIEEADLDSSVAMLAALVNVLAEAERAPPHFLAAIKARAARGWPGIDEAIAALPFSSSVS